jgi:hypothetical protein
MLRNKEGRIEFLKVLFFILNGGLTILAIFYWDKENPSVGSLEILFIIFLPILWLVFFSSFLGISVPHVIDGIVESVKGKPGSLKQAIEKSISVYAVVTNGVEK